MDKKQVQRLESNPIINFDNRTKFDLTAYFSIVKAAATAALDHEGIYGYNVCVSFVTNDEIRALNKRYRDIDKVTDVLSFPLIDDFSEQADGFNELGDVVISFDKAIAQADEYGHGIERELSFLTVHSVLHLLGYDHSDENEEAVMLALQEKILKRIGQIR